MDRFSGRDIIRRFSNAAAALTTSEKIKFFTLFTQRIADGITADAGMLAAFAAENLNTSVADPPLFSIQLGLVTTVIEKCPDVIQAEVATRLIEAINTLKQKTDTASDLHVKALQLARLLAKKRPDLAGKVMSNRDRFDLMIVDLQAEVMGGEKLVGRDMVACYDAAYGDISELQKAEFFALVAQWIKCGNSQDAGMLAACAANHLAAAIGTAELCDDQLAVLTAVIEQCPNEITPESSGQIIAAINALKRNTIPAHDGEQVPAKIRMKAFAVAELLAERRPDLAAKVLSSHDEFEYMMLTFGAELDDGDPPPMSIVVEARPIPEVLPNPAMPVAVLAQAPQQVAPVQSASISINADTKIKSLNTPTIIAATEIDCGIQRCYETILQRETNRDSLTDEICIMNFQQALEMATTEQGLHIPRWREWVREGLRNCPNRFANVSDPAAYRAWLADPQNRSGEIERFAAIYKSIHQSNLAAMAALKDQQSKEVAAKKINKCITDNALSPDVRKIVDFYNIYCRHPVPGQSYGDFENSVQRLSCVNTDEANNPYTVAPPPIFEANDRGAYLGFRNGDAMYIFPKNIEAEMLETSEVRRSTPVFGKHKSISDEPNLKKVKILPAVAKLDDDGKKWKMHTRGCVFESGGGYELTSVAASSDTPRYSYG